MFFGTLHKEMDSPSALYFTGMGGSLLLSLKIGTDYGFWIAGLVAFRLAWDIFNRYLDVDYGTTCYGLLKGIKYAVYIWFSWRLVSIDIMASLLPVTIIIFSMYFIAVWVFDMRKFNKLVAFTWMLTDVIIIWRML